DGHCSRVRLGHATWPHVEGGHVGAEMAQAARHHTLERSRLNEAHATDRKTLGKLHDAFIRPTVDTAVLSAANRSSAGIQKPLLPGVRGIETRQRRIVDQGTTWRPIGVGLEFPLHTRLAITSNRRLSSS
ncbi:MAG TPA: hypothetical protein PK867_16285, partial [Pirellulales bacterium]|nr:hypothetical protein [Pirellulales bacterium]